MSDFVYIIESPSADDLYHHRYESDLLRQAVELSGMKCYARIAADKATFELAIKQGLWEATRECFPANPILHISAHGSTDGIQLTSQDFVTWQELRAFLSPLSISRHYGLMLCMSTCEGLDAIKIALAEKPGTQEAVSLIVGHSGKPTWSETAVAYATFYHLISKGSLVLKAVDAMKTASGNDGFGILISFVERNMKFFPQ